MPNRNRTENLDAVTFPEVTNAPSELKTPQSRNVTLEEWNRTQLRTAILEDFIRALKNEFVPAVKADVQDLGEEFEDLSSDFADLSATVADDLEITFSNNALTIHLKHGDTVIASGTETLPFEDVLFGTPTYADGALTFVKRNYDGTTSTVSVDISGLISVLAATVSSLQTVKYEKPGTGIPKSDLAATVQNTLDQADTDSATLAAHISDSDIHVTTTNKSNWNAKYDKPSGGIPATDLTSEVQGVLSNASADHNTIPSLALVTESGYSLDFSMDPSTFVLTATLKNKAGTVLSTKTVDLPLEYLLLGASISGNTLILTFRTGPNSGDTQTVNTDLSGLIAAAIANKADAADLTAHTSNDIVHITAAERSAWNAKQNAETGKGLSTNDFTDALKNKLDGIEAQANKIVVDSSLSDSSENPVQNKVIKGALDGKANIEGVYDDFIAGTAKQILATVGVVDKVPYNLRTSAGAHDIGSNRETNKNIGGTVIWNQLAKELNSTNYYYEGNQRTFANGSSTYTAVGANDGIRLLTNYAVPRVAGHKYLVTFNADIQITPTITQWAFAWSKTNSETADSETHNINYANSSLGNGRFAFVVEATYTANTAAYLFVRKSGDFEAGDTITTSNYQIYDLTKMFGSTIADYIYSLETTTAGDGVAWFRKLFPKAYYSYNAGQPMSVKTSSHDMVGFNAYNHATGTAILLGGNEYQITGTYTSLSYVDINGDSETITPDANEKFTPTNNGTLTVTGGNDTDTCVHLVWSGSRDGEYEPYVKHSYALDPNLELRGFPKLATDNSLYYDGDEYEGSGQVTRKYGIKTYSAEEITAASPQTNIQYFVVYKPIDAKVYNTTSDSLAKGTCVCSKFDFGTYPTGGAWNDASLVGKIYNSHDQTKFYIGYPVGTTLEEAKADLDGMQIVYELATPTTESAAPFANPQIVDDYGTEQYVDNREVEIPVGHKTLYQANLRDKLQHLPSLYSVNGVVQSGLFHIQQDGTNMVLVPDTSDTRLNALEALVPVYESHTIATTDDWTALSSSDPYDYSATVTATHTIGSNTVVELINNNPVLFAEHGFAIGAVSGQNITIYAIGTPSASVSLEVALHG